MDTLVNELMDIARILVVVVGGCAGGYFIVKGKADENPKEFHEGLIILGTAGVLWAMTYAVEKIFTV